MYDILMAFLIIASFYCGFKNFCETLELQERVQKLEKVEKQ
jgi:hypothetical protein